jgi:hypothetical protein
MVAQYFAQINENNVVINVHVVTAEFMAQNPERYPGIWVETFFNTPGKTYAGINYTYDETTKDFTPPYIEPIETDDDEQ